MNGDSKQQIKTKNATTKWVSVGFMQKKKKKCDSVKYLVKS